MNIETRQAYSEVNKFLELIGEEMSNKIPVKLRKFFEREMDKNYIPTINTDIPIKEQNLKRKTIAIIASLNLQYWCKEDKKQELIEIYSNNEKKYQEDLQEKYNPDNIFKKRTQESVIEEKNIEKEFALVEYKESIFKKLINKIKNIFHSYSRFTVKVSKLCNLSIMIYIWIIFNLPNHS